MLTKKIYQIFSTAKRFKFKKKIYLKKKHTTNYVPNKFVLSIWWSNYR